MYFEIAGEVIDASNMSPAERETILALGGRLHHGENDYYNAHAAADEWREIKEDIADISEEEFEEFFLDLPF